MREGAKRRLAGGAVIVVLAVVFMPMLFDSKPPPSPEPSALPSEPDFDSRFSASGTTDPLRDPGAGDKTSLSASGLGGILDRDLQADPGQPGQIRQGDPAHSGLLSGSARQESPERFAQPDDESVQPVVTPPPVRSSPPVAAKPAPVRAPVKNPPPAAKPVQKSAQQKKESEESRKTPERKTAREKDVAGAAASETRRASAEGNSWVVQVASLGASEAAAQLEQKLRGAGYAAFVEKAEVRGKTYYRVRVGPNADRASAERTAATLRQRQKLDTLIQRHSDTSRSSRE